MTFNSKQFYPPARTFSSAAPIGSGFLKKSMLWAALGVLSALPLFASPIDSACPLISVDEAGFGAVAFSVCQQGVDVPLSGVLTADPGPGGASSVLTYDLQGPPSLVAGDVRITNPGGTVVLDVIRFNPAGAGGSDYAASLLFYSDLFGGDIADTASQPGSFYTNTVTIPGDVGDAFYTPGVSDPGYVDGFAVGYRFVTNGTLSPTPEPSTWALTILGVVVIVTGRRRRIRQRQ